MNIGKFISPKTIESLLQKAPYEPALGIRLVQLTTTPVDDKLFVLIAIKLDKGKQLVPHLHEYDGEILFPLTPGKLTLGKPLRNNKGEFETAQDGKVSVVWESSQQLIPGNPVSILPAVPHHIVASDAIDCMILFFLPQTHLSSDRKFVNYPKTTAK
ncbi:MAG: hypothetical protein KGJ07_10535 [Patescibacteria group bacterium]|nr:hypothetical protein [Patescibacteria group bacterium]